MPLFNPQPCFAGDVRLNVVVNEGDTAELRCYIYNVDFNKTYVSWWKDHELQEITLHLQRNSKRFLLPRQFNEDWTLLIENAQSKDTGRYLCQINSKTVLEKIFYLKVIEKPKTEVPKVDRTFWLVKDEAYNARKTEISKPVNSQPELKYTYYPMRSGPYIIPERTRRPQNDERYQTKPTTTSQGSRRFISMKYLLPPTIIGFVLLRIF
nr:Immunoglobulin [Hymenolepis microstoma]